MTALLVDRFGGQSSSAALCYWRSLWQRDRLDRALLVEYLAAMGVVVDDEARYAEVALVRRRLNWKTRKQTLAQAKKIWMLD